MILQRSDFSELSPSPSPGGPAAKLRRPQVVNAKAKASHRPVDMATKVGRFAGSRNKGPLVVVLGYTGDFFVPSYVGRDYITRIPVEQAPCQTTSMIGSKRVFLFNT